MGYWKYDGTYVDDGGSGGSDYINRLFDVEYPTFSNLFDPSKVTLDFRPESYKGSGLDSAVGAQMTDYIDVSGHAYLYCSYATKVARNGVDGADQYDVTADHGRVGFYDENKTFISKVDPGTAPIPIPSNAKYARASWWNRNGSNIPTREAKWYFVGVAENNTLEVLPWEFFYADENAVVDAQIEHEYATRLDHNHWYGKRWVIFGDSDASDAWNGLNWSGDGWISRVAREFGLTVDNRAVAGTNMYGTINGGVLKLDEYVTAVNGGTAEPPDLITIHFGGNGGRQYGTVDDAPSNSNQSYYSATKYMIETITANFPNCIIGFSLNMDCEPTNTSNIPKEGHDAIKAVLDSDAYKIPYVDLWNNYGLSRATLFLNGGDGVHARYNPAKERFYHAMRGLIASL